MNKFENFFKTCLTVLMAAFAIAIIVVICMLWFARVEQNLSETTTAVYSGYMLKPNDRRYPIVKIGDQEYISEYSQAVRDSSYVGNSVTIRYEKDNLTKFKIVWDDSKGNS